MQLVFSNDFLEVWKDNMTSQSALFATRDFAAGSVICEFSASAILPTPSYLTIQKDNDEHICLHPQFLQFTNHSCAPNIFFDIKEMQVVCLKEISAGSELTYFYPSTEWDMAEPFQCQCGNSNCLRLINGAASLSNEILAQYRLSGFITEQLHRRGSI